LPRRAGAWGAAAGGARREAAAAAAAGGEGGEGAAAPSDSALATGVVLLAAWVTGTYFMSTLLLLRMSVPEAYRAPITGALGNISFNFFHRWFDVIFVLSACISIVVLMLVAATRSSRISSSLERGAGAAAPFAPPQQPAAAAARGGGGGGGGGARPPPQLLPTAPSAASAAAAAHRHAHERLSPPDARLGAAEGEHHRRSLWRAAHGEGGPRERAGGSVSPARSVSSVV